MKNLIVINLLIILCCSTGNVIAQNNDKENSYSKKMTTALMFWKQQKNALATTKLNELVLTEQDKWLPHYYIALIEVTDIFLHKSDTPINTKIKNALRHSESANILSPNNPEILSLQALIVLAEMLHNNPKDKNSYLVKAENLYQKALKIDPNNPRAFAGYADYHFNKAKHRGEDTQIHCKNLQKALSLFKDEKQAYLFAPTWGKQRIELMLNYCN